jgi:hypothetical protein
MSNYVYHFTKSKKLDEKTYQCASVEVFNLDGKSLGSYAWSRPRPSERDIEYMVSELIREYETRKIWNSRKVTA